MGQMLARVWSEPMRILIINPNSTASMTEKIAESARLVANSDTIVEAVNPTQSPAAIQGEEDGLAALPHLFELFDRKTSSKHYDAVIIACFDDTGVVELKGRGPMPAVGIGEAAYHAASLLGGQFSVVTTLSVSCPIIETNIAAYGFSKQTAHVRASEIPVLAFEDQPESSFDKLSLEMEAALSQDGCRSIILGCAGMADLAQKLSQKHKVPVIDGVKAAVGLVEMLHNTLKI
ncbi:MAG: aspartate/glutamate racemase family protein [Rhizobiaceae bacterium]